MSNRRKGKETGLWKVSFDRSYFLCIAVLVGTVLSYVLVAAALGTPIAAIKAHAGQVVSVAVVFAVLISTIDSMIRSSRAKPRQLRGVEAQIIARQRLQADRRRRGGRFGI